MAAGRCGGEFPPWRTWGSSPYRPSPKRPSWLRYARPAEASQASRRRTTHAGATPGLRLKSSPPPSHHLRPRRANPPAAGQREGSSRGYWLDSQRFSDGRLEFADAILELNDMLGRSRRGRDGWREKCEDAKHRHQKLQELDGDWLAWRAGRILAQIGPCWQGRRKGDLRSRRQRKGRAAFWRARPGRGHQ